MPPPLWIADQVRNDVCGASMRVPRPVDSRLRGNDGEGRGSDGERLVCLIHPLIPVSGTGSPSPLIPLSSRERGILSIGFVRVSSKFLSGRGYQCDV